MSDDLLEYGAKANANEIKKTLEHIFERNDAIAEKGGRQRGCSPIRPRPQAASPRG